MRNGLLAARAGRGRAVLPVTAFVAAIATAVALLAPGMAAATCLEVSEPDLRPVDRLANGEPGRAIRTVQDLLGSTPPGSTLRRAELLAILAEAHVQASEPRDGQQAAEQAASLLASLPPSPATRRLDVRLALIRADALSASNDSATSLELLNKLVPTLAEDSEERSCALAQRLIANALTGAIDQAAADGVTAYRIAEAGGYADARINAALGLAVVYRRAGLLANAETMNNEVIAFATERRLPALLANAEFARAYIMIEAQRYSEAIAALKIHRDNSAAINDATGVAVADLMTCVAYVAQKDFAAAEAPCRVDEKIFRDAQRTDLIGILHGERAEVALGHGRLQEALREFDAALAGSGPAIPVFLRTQFYADRATTRERLGDVRGAYGDLLESHRLERDSNLAQRLRAVGVLGAAAQAERLTTENRLLEQNLARQRLEVDHQKYVRYLWVGASILAALFALVLLYFLWVTRRQSRTLRRQTTIVRTVASHAPDALVLLDAEQRVLFTNRDLFGGQGLYRTGEPLVGQLPAQAEAVLGAALDKIYRERSTTHVAISLAGPAGEIRNFELTGGPAVEDGRLIGVVLRSIDVTAVRRLEHEVIDVSNRERQRLSEDLHEGLGQELTGVMLMLRSLLTGLDRGKSVPRHEIAELLEHVNGSIETARKIARGLSPVRIERGSLGDAIGRLATDAGRRLGLNIGVRCEPAELAVTDAAADHLYRIVLEAITNAARHANCRAVDVALTATNGLLTLTIRDDGTTPLVSHRDHEGLGLKTMGYRARLLGGEMKIEGAPGAGTTLIVSVPLSHVSEGAAAAARVPQAGPALPPSANQTVLS
jgi:signal transduction histidine kinase